MKKTLPYLLGLHTALILVFSSIYLQSSAQMWNWASRAASDGYEYARHIRYTEDNDFVYVVGTMGKGCNPALLVFDTIAPFPYPNIENNTFLAKFTAAGTLVWVKHFGSIGMDEGYHFDLDNEGNIYVGGYYYDTLKIDQHRLPATGLGENGFIAKFTPNGNCIWMKRTVSPASYVTAIRYNAASNDLYIAGTFQDSVQYEGFQVQKIASNSSLETFYAKIDTAGNCIWLKAAGGIGMDWTNAITSDPDGNLYATGKYTINIVFDTDTLQYIGGQWEIFVVKYDSQGNYVWAINGGGGGEDIGYDIKYDPFSGHIYVTGSSQVSCTFGSFVSGQVSGTNIFLVKIDTAGTPQALFYPPSTTFASMAYGMDIAQNGNIYLTGAVGFNGYLVMGYDTLTSAGLTDVLVACIDPNFQPVWAMTASGTFHDYGTSITVNKTGTECFVAGNYASYPTSFGTFDLTRIGSSFEDAFFAKLVSLPLHNEILEKETTFHLYPNPATDYIRVETNPSDGYSLLEIMDLSGKTIRSMAITNPVMEVDIQSVPRGMYLVKLTGKASAQVRKLIKS